MTQDDHQWQISYSKLDGLDFVGLELPDQTGECAVKVSIPADELLELLSPYLKPLLDLTLDGKIIVAMELGNGPSSPSDLPGLLETALDPHMLEDDPDVRQHLLNLQELFSRSAERVGAALTQISRDKD